MSVFDRVFGRNLVFPCAGVELGSGLTLTANSTLTTDSPRYTYLNATGGAFAVTLPGSTSGVYEGFTLYLCENAGSSNAVTVSAPGLQINGAASLVLASPYRQVELRYNGTQYIVRTSGSTFDPARPGPIGSTTPGTVTATDLFLTTTASAAQPGKLQLVSTAGQGALLIRAGSGCDTQLGQEPSSTTARAAMRTLSITLAANATYDYTTSGLGGHAVIATTDGAIVATIGFSGAGVTTTGGATYTNFSTTLTTASKLNVGASSGNLRFENKTAGTISVVATITQFLQA